MQKSISSTAYKDGMITGMSEHMATYSGYSEDVEMESETIFSPTQTVLRDGCDNFHGEPVGESSIFDFLDENDNNVNLLISAKKLATKDMAIKYRKHEKFNFIINIVCNQKDKYKIIEEFIKNKCSHLQEARSFLKSIVL